MKSVLISIQPKWVEKIANGEKTIEVRKSVPKCEVPFKCYIYCTKSTRAHVFHLYINGGIGRQEFGITGHWRSGKKVVEVNPHLPAYRYNSYLAEGKVIGEFVCDKVDKYTFSHYEAEYRITHVEQKAMCLNQPELIQYGKGKTLYGLHISDLKIYDKPKELSEFHTIDERGSDCCCGCVYHETPLEEMPCRTCTGERRYLYRPPQSWQYVEEMEQ